MAGDAIGRVTVGGQVRGSAFAISPTHLLTAFHCVRGEDKDQLTGEPIGFAPVGVEPLRVERALSLDPARDFALLELAQALPEGWDPIPVIAMREQLREATFQSKGFPGDLHPKQDILSMHGSIVDPTASLDGVPALQMFSNEIAAGRDPRGFSGAPVRVKTSWWADDGEMRSGWAAVALVWWAQPEPQGRRVGYGGVVFASPLAEIAAADSTVASLLIASAPPAGTRKGGGFPWPRGYPRRFKDELAAAEEFVGREALLERIGAFPDDHDRGYVHVEASAGLGKSALAARFASLESAPAFFADAGSGMVRADQCALHLGAETALRHDLDLDRFDDWGADADILPAVLEVAGETDSGPVWLVVDGLDEAEAAPAGANPLMLPSRLPPGVFVLLTSREPASRFFAGEETPMSALSLTADGEEERYDLTRFIAERIERDPRAVAALADSHTHEEFATQLAAAAEGNFMYATYVLEDLAEGKLDPDSPPERLFGYYERRFWTAMEVQRERDPASWSDLYRPVLERLAVAAEPVSAEWLAGQVGRPTPEVEDMVLPPWRRFLRSDSADGSQRWRIVHHSFADFLATKLSLSDAHRSVARAGRDSLDPYAHRHLAEHLRQAGELDELAALVADPTWEEEQLSVDPAGELLVHDIEQLRLAADAVDEAAQEASSPPSQLATAVWSTLAVASVRTSMQSVPPTLLAVLVEEELWPRDRALRTARQAPDPGPRARGIALLARDNPRLQEEALAAAEEVGELIRRAEVMIEVARGLPEGRREEVLLGLLEVAQTAEGFSYERPQTAKHLVPDLLAAALPAVFEIARTTSADYDRCDLFLALAKRDPQAVAEDPEARAALERNGLPEQLLDVLAVPPSSPEAPLAAASLLDELDAAEIPVWAGSQRSVAWLTTALASHLDAAGLRRMLAICRDVGGIAGDTSSDLVAGFLRVDEPEMALDALSPVGDVAGARAIARDAAGRTGLPASFLTRALALVAKHPIAYERTEAIATLVPLLSAQQRVAAIEAVLPREEFRDGELRAWALRDYSPFLDPEQALELLSLLPSRYSSSDFAYGLAAVAPALPESALEKAFSEADLVHYKADDRARAAIVERLSGESLLAAARTIAKRRELGDPAAIAVARNLDSAGREEMLLLLVAWPLGVAPAAVLALAPYLSDEQAEQAIGLLDEDGARRFSVLRSVGLPWRGAEDSPAAFAARLRSLECSPSWSPTPSAS